MTDTRALRLFSAVAAAAVCGLLATVGVVVIPQQIELARQQEEALRNHNEIKARQILILERLAAVEAVAVPVAARPPLRPE